MVVVGAQKRLAFYTDVVCRRDLCASGEGRKQDDADLARIRERMASVKHKVIKAGGRCVISL